jgi:hypothetical protein
MTSTAFGRAGRTRTLFRGAETGTSRRFGELEEAVSPTIDSPPCLPSLGRWPARPARRSVVSLSTRSKIHLLPLDLPSSSLDRRLRLLLFALELNLSSTSSTIRSLARDCLPSFIRRWLSLPLPLSRRLRPLLLSFRSCTSSTIPSPHLVQHRRSFLLLVPRRLSLPGPSPMERQT